MQTLQQQHHHPGGYTRTRDIKVKYPDPREVPIRNATPNPKKSQFTLVTSGSPYSGADQKSIPTPPQNSFKRYEGFSRYTDHKINYTKSSKGFAGSNPSEDIRIELPIDLDVKIACNNLTGPTTHSKRAGPKDTYPSDPPKTVYSRPFNVSPENSFSNKIAYPRDGDPNTFHVYQNAPSASGMLRNASEVPVQMLQEQVVYQPISNPQPDLATDRPPRYSTIVPRRVQYSNGAVQALSTVQPHALSGPTPFSFDHNAGVTPQYVPRPSQLGGPVRQTSLQNVHERIEPSHPAVPTTTRVNRHVQIYRPLGRSTMNSRPSHFACKYCRTSFNSEDEQDVHERLECDHSPEWVSEKSQFRCNYCPKSFDRGADRDRHERCSCPKNQDDTTFTPQADSCTSLCAAQCTVPGHLTPYKHPKKLNTYMKKMLGWTKKPGKREWKSSVETGDSDTEEYEHPAFG